jgi:prepilin peptidase CpaA
MEETMGTQVGASFELPGFVAVIRREILPTFAATLVVACFTFSAGETPLPAFGWAAAFLFFCVQQDVRGMRIPNWLTLPGLAIAIAVAAFDSGFQGALWALTGAATALGLLFLPFAFRWLGAGDVKAVMVFGALWGAANLLPALWWMIVAGGLMAVAMIAVQGGLVDLLRRWGLSAKHTFLFRRVVYFAPDSESPAAKGLPFAVAMGLGAAAHQLWGSAWI